MILTCYFKTNGSANGCLRITDKKSKGKKKTKLGTKYLFFSLKIKKDFSFRKKIPFFPSTFTFL